MKIEVVYRSMTGHSKKIAKAVAAEFGVEAQNIKDKPWIEGVDLLVLVGGIYSGESLPDMLDFVRRLESPRVKRAALITSSCRDKTGQMQVRVILESNGIEIAGEYRCRGNFLFFKMGHPNKKEISDAVEFVKGLCG